MRRPVKRVFTVIAMIVVLIFGQLSIAAYACASAGNSGSSVSMASPMPADSHADLRDHHAGVACHAHCDNSAQPNHAEQPAPPALVWLPLVWGHSAIGTLALQSYLPAHAEPILISASPPPRILFQVFRT